MNERQFLDLMSLYEGNLQELNIRINFPNGNSKMIDTSSSDLDYSALESYFKGLFETGARENPESEFLKGAGGLPSVEAATIEVVSFDKIEHKNNRVYCFVEIGLEATGIGRMRLDLIFSTTEIDNPDRFESMVLKKIKQDA